MTIVDPVDAGNVSSLSTAVASGIGGIILFGTDATPALGNQLRQLLALAPSGRAPFVMVDEEGGAVQRLISVVGNVPSARTMGQTMNPAAINALARSLGKKMRQLGVTMDLAPVLDLDGRPGPSATNSDGTRSFSPDPGIASADGLAFAKGLLASGVLPVLKHFPGLGGATGNTDLERAATKAYVGPKTSGLQPFSAALAAGMPAVMIANATVPGLTAIPASLSPAAIDGLLRKQLGFSGLVISDSLTAVSISASGYSLPVAALAAIRAGTDEVLFNALPNQIASYNSAIVNALVSAVSSKRLSRLRLVQAALHAQSAKALINAC
jgi:beta-N-acetylhexosaminidase